MEAKYLMFNQFDRKYLFILNTIPQFIHTIVPEHYKAKKPRHTTRKKKPIHPEVVIKDTLSSKQLLVEDLFGETKD